MNPTKDRRSTRAVVGEMAKYSVSNYGLVLFTVLLIVGFGLARPGIFLTTFTLRSILSTVAITVLFALAETIVIAAQQFDLSVGYMGGFSAIIVIMLLVRTGIPWPIVVLFGIIIGLLGGLVNGLLVTVLKIDSFIVTLGTGTVAYGLSEFVTGGVQIVGNMPAGFSDIGNTVLGIPISALIALGVAAVGWVVLEYTIFGRRLYVVGASVRGAELVGLRPPRLIRRAFVVAGIFVGIGAVLVAAQFQVAEPDIGPEYLLPAFAAAFLGATSVRPGRVNVWGTVVAALLLSIAETGLLELGAAFYVSSLFSGSLLIVAVGVTAMTGQRKAKPTSSGGRTEPAGQGNPDQGARVVQDENLSALAVAVQSRRHALGGSSDK